ncbi:hypothetical protein CKY51_08685 [Xanthomonas maliensis]|nr:hypothetical protein CKY51_08685 [Xanthomonas maliensis]
MIEHVGDIARMQAFAAEIRRVAAHYYVQTPKAWFPTEPHSLAPGLQFLPRAWQAELWYQIPLGAWSERRRVGRLAASCRASACSQARHGTRVSRRQHDRRTFLWLR